ncbi:MAG: chromosome segregation protein SMC, partial [Salinarimonas sp.]
RDRERQQALIADAGSSIARLEEEARGLGEDGADAARAREAAQARCATHDAALAEAEQAFDAAQATLSDLNARRAALERSAREEAERATRLARQREEREAQRRDLAEAVEAADLEVLRETYEEASVRAEAADERAASAREMLVAAREAENRARGPVAESERRAQRLETEAATLAKFFAAPGGEAHAPLIDSVSVEKGFEIALGAALGEDLEAGEDARAPTHWRALDAAGDATLPAEATPLARHVTAPLVLARALAQIGVVADRETGARLQSALAGGQILVTRAGDLWRWDGYAAAGDAPTAAARRLAERNRLGDLEREAAQARDEAELARRDLDFAQAAARAAATGENQALEAARQARRVRDEAGARLSQAERADADRLARLAGVEEALARLDADAQEAEGRAEQAREALEELAPTATLEAELAAARIRAVEARNESAKAHALLQGLVREAELAAQRRRAIALEIGNWSERAENARAALEDIDERIAAAREELEALREAPDDFHMRRRRLEAEIENAEAARRQAADRLAEGETAQAETDRSAREALASLSAVRESAAAAQARRDALQARVTELDRAIRDNLETTPQGLYALAGLAPDAALPASEEIEQKLLLLRHDRERLGAVNLRAEEELREIEERRDSLGAERDDLVEAIKRLRQAVSSLNREGRERLLAAFDVVNGHFKALFTTLFGGGEAELTLVDSDDPLEAGLEILARPPGKKPQTMTLLSGGEQALTATALIFAVFLTNPSPICVLDEVDAPLDDANVERYCDLLDEMARTTRTRFLVITHNPITMARMNRLYGVTMAERGVSQLVSVDLERAERLREAG